MALRQAPAKAPRIELQPRDLDILAAVFHHRFLQPAHVHALLGGGYERLTKRLRLLWQAGYLDRPRTQGARGILTEEVVYGLGKAGARLLQEHDPDLKIGHLDWHDRPGKPVTYPYIDHQLGIATFMVALERACEGSPLRVEWPGHYERSRYKIPVPGENRRFHPDAYFRLVREDDKIAHHFLEVMRSRRTLDGMRAKYETYFRWWRGAMDRRPFRHFRVITVAPNAAFMASLRKAARPIGQTADHPRSWSALLFTHFEAFSLEKPEGILEPIFRSADDPIPVALAP